MRIYISEYMFQVIRYIKFLNLHINVSIRQCFILLYSVSIIIALIRRDQQKSCGDGAIKSWDFFVTLHLGLHLHYSESLQFHIMYKWCQRCSHNVECEYPSTVNLESVCTSFRLLGIQWGFHNQLYQDVYGNL